MQFLWKKRSMMDEAKVSQSLSKTFFWNDTISNQCRNAWKEWKILFLQFFLCHSTLHKLKKGYCILQEKIRILKVQSGKITF